MPGIKILPLKLPLVKHPSAKSLLYPHQALMLDLWMDYNTFLLITKTGTGKTIAAILPVIKNRERAICVYPTNELIRDQVRNIESIAKREDLRTCILTPETTAEDYASADLILVHIDASTLDLWRKKNHWKDKWRALKILLEADKPKIVLTNPDILFLIFSLRYHAEPLAALSGYHNLILDEFHLYSGVELAHALFMLHLGRNLGMFRKILLLSATPADDVAEYLNRILDNPFSINENLTCNHKIIDERQAVQRIDVIPILSGSDVIETAVALVKDLHGQIHRLREENQEADYIPAVVVVNSVINAIRLEDRLADEGFKDKMAIIRGLSSKEVRDTRGKLLAIGTSAIEVGIDFKCDYLIFEAFEAASFMQRFGRVGRHKPGIAYILCSQNVVIGIDNLLHDLGPEVNRSDLEKRVYSWYPSLQTRAWFATTLMGLISSFTMGENLLKRIRDDPKSSPEHLSKIEATIDKFYESYVQKIGCPDSLSKSVMSYIHNGRQDKKRYHWLNVYRDLDTFRTSMPSEWIADLAELERRCSNWAKAKYRADIATLLRRAEGLRFNEKIQNPDGGMGMLTVSGYGRYKKVWLMPTFTDDDCGRVFCTHDFPDMLFMQEGHKTSVSHVMTLKNHIFMVFPKLISSELDWRLPVFECGEHVVGFDGTALMLYEIYKQKNKAIDAGTS
jgi:CRISPR-associated endonuclease/helicase Cas3